MTYNSLKFKLDDLQHSNDLADILLSQLKEELNKKFHIDDLRISTIKDKANILMQLIRQESVDADFDHANLI